MTRAELDDLRFHALLALKEYFVVSLNPDSNLHAYPDQVAAAAELHAACCREIKLDSPHLSEFGFQQVIAACASLDQICEEGKDNFEAVEDAKEALLALLTSGSPLGRDPSDQADEKDGDQ